ncbi:MAG TPA: nicotinate (nicotinamide) nucleotide adenylyltransferase, partial [Brumimicrobium sp.]|nr:nicotinate (nicotinamide) nucleotide adenylyltransferase [Brumimicrobium sp.]
LEDYHRLDIVHVAIEDNDKLRVSDIEFKMPRPSYTADTLAYLKEKHPKNEFHLIMGEDNLRTFHKWKNREYIIENHKLYVYPRVLTVQEEQEIQEIGSITKSDYYTHKNVILLNDAPVMRLSSSFIRQAIKENKDVRYLLTDVVHEYIDKMGYYG